MREAGVPLFSLESCFAGARLRPRRHHDPLRAHVHEHPRDARPGRHPAARARPRPRAIRWSSAAARACSTPSRSRRSSTRSSSARARRRWPTSSPRTAQREAAGLTRARDARSARDGPGRVRAVALRGRSGRTTARSRACSAIGDAPERSSKRVVADLDAVRAPVEPIVPFMDVVHDRFGIEVLRGCTRGCRFCQAGMVYRPVRERTADTIVRDVAGGPGVHAATTRSRSRRSRPPTTASSRRSCGGCSAGSRAPASRCRCRRCAWTRSASRWRGSCRRAARRAGSPSRPRPARSGMRDVINKNVTEEDLLGSVERAFAAGWRRVKLYFMIGLPTETDDDIRGIGELVHKVSRHGARGDAARAARRIARRGLACRRSCPRRRRRSSGSRRSRSRRYGAARASSASRCRARASSCTGTTRTSRSSRASWRGAAEKSPT